MKQYRGSFLGFVLIAMHKFGMWAAAKSYCLAEPDNCTQKFYDDKGWMAKLDLLDYNALIRTLIPAHS